MTGSSSTDAPSARASPAARDARASAVEGPRGVATDRPLPWGSALFAALVVTFVRPSLWPLALAGFLARGGVLLLVVPIVVLPTPSGLANVLGGPVASLLFGAPSPELLTMLAAATILGTLALGVGTYVGAWAETVVIRESLAVAADEGLVPVAAGRAVPGAGAGWVMVLRLLGLMPFGVALLLAAEPLYHAVYRQLVLPDELSTPLLLRVLGDIPAPLLWLALTWLLGDAAAAIAVRRLLLDGRSLPAAYVLGWFGLIRRPLRAAGTALATIAMVALLILPAIVASATGWARLRTLLVDGGEPVPVAIAVVLCVAVWLGGLVLAGAAATFRGGAWTFDLVRRPGPSFLRP